MKEIKVLIEGMHLKIGSNESNKGIEVYIGKH